MKPMNSTNRIASEYILQTGHTATARLYGKEDKEKLHLSLV